MALLVPERRPSNIFCVKDSGFTALLLEWHDVANSRTLPWKGENDPYKIWLSEVILQQTRALQGLSYYERFIEAYPDIGSLADADDEEVFRLWQGLGYYNRCRNLLSAARTIVSDMAGRFPSDYHDILSLKGVGTYTAAAIASFAFGLPHAVVDGNVYRVLARYFGIDLPIDGSAGKAHFQKLAQDLLAVDRPADYNQAIMDFGATICKPKSPLCDSCPLSSGCLAYARQMIDLLPVKEKKLLVRKRCFHYCVLLHGDEVYIQKREKKDIWQGLYEFFLIELEEGQGIEGQSQWDSLKPFAEHIDENSYDYAQKLTHQNIYSKFHLLQLRAKPAFLDKGIWVKKHFFKNYAFPKTILSFSNRKKYF